MGLMDSLNKRIGAEATVLYAESHGEVSTLRRESVATGTDTGTSPDETTQDSNAPKSYAEPMTTITATHTAPLRHTETDDAAMIALLGRMSKACTFMEAHMFDAQGAAQMENLRDLAEQFWLASTARMVRVTLA